MAIENLGEALSGFMGGYTRAQQTKQQREEQERTKAHEKADSLLPMLQLAEKHFPSAVPNLVELYADAKDRANSGPSKTKNKDGIGNMIRRMFGAGGREELPYEPGPMSTMLQNQEMERQSKKETLPQQQSGTRNFGSVDGLFGGPAVSENRPQMPPSPDTGSISSMFGQSAMSKEKPDAGTAFGGPQMSKPTDSPVAQYAQNQPAQSRMAQQQSSAAQAYGLRNVQPTELQQQVRAQAEGKFGIVNPEVLAQHLQQNLDQILDEDLSDLDAFLDSTPGPDTIDSVMANPQARRAIDHLRRYEAAGLIQKGTIDSYLDPKGGRVVAATDAAKEESPEIKWERQVTPIFQKGGDSQAWSPQERQLVGGWKAFLDAKASRQGLTAEQQLESSAIAAMLKPENQRTPEDTRAIDTLQQFKRFGSSGPQPVRNQIITLNPKTGKMEHAEYVEGSNAPIRFIGALAANQFDLDSLMQPVTTQIQNPTTKLYEFKTFKDYVPQLVIRAANNGFITKDSIQGFIDATQDPAAKEILKQYASNPARFEYY